MAENRELNPRPQPEPPVDVKPDTEEDYQAALAELSRAMQDQITARKAEAEKAAQAAKSQQPAPKKDAPLPVATADQAPAESSPPEPSAKQLPVSLVERALAMGWTEDELVNEPDVAALEKLVSRVERDRAHRDKPPAREKPGPKAKGKEPEPEPEPTPEESLADLLVKLEVEPDVAKLLSGHFDKLKDQLEAVKKEQEPYRQWVEQQAHERALDQLTAITDKLFAAGWEQVGKGRAKPNSAAWDNQMRIYGLVSAELEAYNRMGLSLDWDEAAAKHAERLWGPAQKKNGEHQPAPAADQRERDEKGRFVKPPQASTSERPTARQPGDDEKPSRLKAAKALHQHLISETNGMFQAFGAALPPDIHGDF